MNTRRINTNSVKAAVVLFIAGLFVIPGTASLLQASSNTATFHEINHGLSNGGTTYYVDDDNINGPWDGSLEHPYRYIQVAIENAYDGDTIYVFNGRYQEHVTIYKDLEVIGEDKKFTVIDGGRDDTVVRITVPSVYFSGFTVQKSGIESNNAGLCINSPDNCIVGNIFVHNFYGVYVDSPGNRIYHNNFIENTYQAYDESSNSWDNGNPCGGNFWDDYTGVDENEDGIGESTYSIPGYGNSDYYPLIHSFGSVMNLDTKEIFLTIQKGIADADTLDGQVLSVKNNVYDEHISVYKSLIVQGEDAELTVIDGRLTGDVISVCDDSVTLKNFTIQHSGTDENNSGLQITSDKNVITDMIIQENYQGLVLKQSANESVISNNMIRDNEWNGILIKNNCHVNIIEENTIENNRYAGIGIADSSYNIIFHNSLIGNLINAYDNANNIWDDNYPSGGNYWSDYTGVDADQNGIGDTPYSIATGINKDRYPLMAPYTDVDTIPPHVKFIAPQNGIYLRGHQLFSGLIKQKSIIVGKITVQAEVFDAQSGIERVEFYVDDRVLPKATLYQLPYEWTWTTRSFIKHQHMLFVIAYDKAGNANVDMLLVKRFL